MSTEDKPEDLTSKSEGNNLAITDKLGFVVQETLSTKTPTNGSGDHTQAASTSTPDVSDQLPTASSSENQPSLQKPAEVGFGDHNPDIPLVASPKPAVSEQNVDTSSTVEKETSIDVKDKEVGVSSIDTGVILSADDGDSENQDEDLVLKWDDEDDEENIGLLPDKEENKKIEEISECQQPVGETNLDAESQTKHFDDNEQIVTTSLITDAPKSFTNIEVENADLDKNVSTSKEIVQVTSSIDNKAEYLDKSLESSEDAIENEDLLSEIDAQIAELDANLSKAENEKSVPDQTVSSLTKITNTDTTQKSVPLSIKNVEIDQEDIQLESSSNVTENKEVIPTTISLPDDNVTITADSNVIQNTSHIEVSSAQPNDNQMDISKEDKLKNVTCDAKEKTENASNEIIDDLTSNTDEDTSIKVGALANSTQILDDSAMESVEVDKGSASSHDISVKPREHGLTEPNMMLEIPTQELIDLDEAVDVTQDENMSVDNSLNLETSKLQSADVMNVIEESKPTICNLDKDQISTENLQEKRSTDDGLRRKATEPLEKNEINTCSLDNTQLGKDKTEMAAKEREPELNKEVTNDSIQNNETVSTTVSNTPADKEINNRKVEKIVSSNITVDKGVENMIVESIADNMPTDEMKVEEKVDDSKLDKEVKDGVVESETATDSKNTVADKNEKIVSCNTELNKEVNQEVSIENNITNIENKDDNEEEVMKETPSLILPATSLKESPESSAEPQTVSIATPTVVESESNDEVSKVDKIGLSAETLDVQPSTSKAPDVLPSTSSQESQMAPDALDDAADVTDSLGLLAEFAPVEEDDDDQEFSEHDEDDDDFEPDDESSNQLGPDQSEDSAQQSETDAPKQLPDNVDKDNDDTQDGEKELNANDALFDALLESSKELPDQNKEATDEKIPSVASDENKDDGEMDIEDDIVCDEVEVAPDNLIGDADPSVDEALDATLDALDAALDAHEKTPEASSTEQVKEAEATKEDDKEENDVSKELGMSTLRALLLEKKDDKPVEDSSTSPKKVKIVSPSLVLVDLEESSSEDDVQEVKKKKIDVSEVVKEISIPLSASSAALKITPRLNMSEISIKTTSTPKPPLVIPETKMSETKDTSKKKFGALEVFNLDSDDEESAPVLVTDPAPKSPEIELEKDKELQPKRCINLACSSDGSVAYYPANGAVRAYYDCNKKRALVCLPCLYEQVTRSQRLVEGIKNFTPLLQLETSKTKQELVEISDSDSEDEADTHADPDREMIAEPVILERQLADMINATWTKYKLDVLLKDAQDELMVDIDRLEKEGKEVNQMLNECQIATDKLRQDLYGTFEAQHHELPAIIIYDAPDKQFTSLETVMTPKEQASQAAKRRLSSAEESKSKKPTIVPVPADQTDETRKIVSTSTPDTKQDDDKEVSVVNLSAECAPASLPPQGEPARPALAPGMSVYAMRHAFGSWIKARLTEVTPKGTDRESQQFTMCRLEFKNKGNRNANKVFPARQIAYFEPSNVRMTIGTRVIALFKDTSQGEKVPREAFYSGVVAEIPNPVNSYRYLVFFDDGYAQYVQHADTRLVCESSSLVWEEVHSFSREFVKEYLLAYPERPMVRLHTGQVLKTEWNGKWWPSRVVAVDASLVQVYFEHDRRTEWIYRGSTRLAPLYLELQAAGKHRARPLPRNRLQNKFNMPYVEYTRSVELDPAKGASQDDIKAQQEEIRRQRAVAKKSTVAINQPPPPAHVAPGNLESVTSRVVYYTPKNAVKPHKMVPHTCGPRCKRTDVLSLKELRTYNPLAKPLLSGWERQIVRYKGHKEVMYRAPCGRRLRNMKELHRYLRTVNSDMGVDLFDFGPNTHCLAEFVLNKCIVGKKDLSHGKENVPVPCVNYHDNSLPEFCSYNTERTPTAGVPLNLDPDFLCGCDCTDDCEDKSKCACWKLTLEGAHTIGLEGDNVGYEYKRLPEPLPSGIYECNVRCKCKSTCLNRVAQHPLQLKLQVFKTVNRGWGIRALNDVPKGSFLCIYAGNLLTDATANLDGLNEGDEYLAELDYIEVVEQMKEGYEEDIPEDAKKLDKKESGKSASEESEPSESEEEETKSKSDEEDHDFQPAYIPGAVTAFSKRLRKREKKKQKEEEDKKEKEKQKEKEGTKEGANGDDCITISDDEEIREPSRFAAQAGMGEKYVSKHRSVRSHFGKDEACYIMDAKVQGNIGRYLNHSCSPNVFVQNVFVDTHDPRFPWVAFFALHHIRAGTELTWNYNYDVGSVPGKALYCYCGANNCRGRLL